ncbi:hypothetical protein BJF89_17660 [Corynebacterium sp. CNJ-954]|uniref:hypothetical protein n=1 Tax=Corynebacterium sp. CNJ-954 TaxID=1904962 RepID=UPI000963111F|nr:hypothetical protein [Corynebacterium sp. CNJ-954]OLT53331.1 hypothetical protein BJF89_17660 [Corynebacterium sp. CNJ-954]
MSLINPLHDDRSREAQFEGGSKALSALLLWGLVALLTTGMVGFAIGGVFDQFRIVSLNSVFSTWDTNIPLAVRGVALPLGILASIFTVGQYGKWNHRYTGDNRSYTVAGPLTLILVGLAGGTWIATTMWVEPDAVGTAVDPVFFRDELWGWGAWCLYAAQWWLPGMFATLAVVSYAGRIVARRRLGARNRLVTDLLRTGSLVEAEVVDAPLPIPDASRMAASLVVKFKDAENHDRWVRCFVLLAPQSMPTVGDRRPLVFDPRQPGSTERIFLSPSGGTAPEDFQPVTTT